MDEVIFKEKKIHFKITGSGPAIVFLHGFTESLEIWNAFATRLKKQCTVVCIDLPAHGKSEVVEKVLTMDLIADIVKHVLDECKIKQCVMVGHSMGGYVTMAFAEKYPEMLKGFCLFHSNASADSEEAKQNRDRAAALVLSSHSEFLYSFIPDLFAPENVKKFTVEIEELKNAAASQMTPEGIVACLKGMKERPDRTHVLKNSKVPVLFILGKKDKRIPVDVVMKQVVLPAHSQLLLLDIGHMGYLEAKEETFQVIRDFTASFLL
ncbi:MAG: alpha/beta hydrolase [Bacteroidota bacterium]